MANIKIMQGDSYPIYVNIRQDGYTLTPSLITDLEICVGDNLRKTYRSGGVKFDSNLQKWYFIPTQNETFALSAGSHEVITRIKYYGTDQFVKGKKAGTIIVSETNSQEVL